MKENPKEICKKKKKRRTMWRRRFAQETESEIFKYSPMHHQITLEFNSVGLYHLLLFLRTAQAEKYL
ncbi:hypothetical protein BpHYR1_051622 [Brachionus plicatilis]|uniref:Uncharacterized protein n=1 Tax=Brachionus plicatilis TaxID=10195 RepID=A0A3M7R018_BRAPC|nr:hypothetical protein BpHYR1_051622 [Brachionus plicatilis]